MNSAGGFTKTVGAILLVALIVLTGGVASATPTNWNDANFKSVWERTDKPIEDGATSRSWMWGPQTVPGSPAMEPYVEAPGGARVVQYFDKSRMEVNNPGGDRSQLWFVTNGLLVREMVSGDLQLGNASYTKRSPSQEAVAGDPANGNSDTPTYASFADIASLNNDHPSVDRTGGTVQEFVDKAGSTTSGASPDPQVTYFYFDTSLKHNIPNKFWEFMNQTGPVYWNGSMGTDTVINWVFAMGYPLTEPYWTKAKVGGLEKNVLVQLYERRVLTYTPDNPEGFKVEMGNVGQHYKRWRYDTPTAERLAFASNRSGHMQVWTMKTDGGDLKKLTNVGQNMRPRWSPDNNKIAFESHRDDNWEIYVMNADGSDERRLTNDAASDTSASWSSDGTRIIWSKDGDIYTMAADGGEVRQITSGPALDTSPFYSPDGAWLVWSSNASGNFEVYKSKLDGSGKATLTNLPEALDFPSDWRGNTILYTSGEDGHNSIWSMNDDGSNTKKLKGDEDNTGRYSPDASRIVYVSNGDIKIMNADGTNVSKVTHSGSLDTQPDWSH